MTNPVLPSTPHSKSVPPGLPWLLILGLSSLALIWPLTAFMGWGDGGPRALVIIGLIAATWIGVVGLARVRRPVLTLTLVGVGYGAIALVVATVLGSFDRPLWTVLVALVLDAFWGAIAGLIAFAIQTPRARR